MFISTFELFKIGIGPSSSHTVGPMRAAGTFVGQLTEEGLLDQVSRVRVLLYGSLGATGRGHGTDRAVIGGLEGYQPQSVDPVHLSTRFEDVHRTRQLQLAGIRKIAFNYEEDVEFSGVVLPFHANALKLMALDETGAELRNKTYYSIGGGFIVDEEEMAENAGDAPKPFSIDEISVPYKFQNAAELLGQCEREQLRISELMLTNEIAYRQKGRDRAGEQTLGEPIVRQLIRSQLLEIWSEMHACIQRGLATEGVLPGGLKIARRAPGLYRKLQQESSATAIPLAALDWVDAWALAVSEENAAGSRVVTAPTNGAAGVIPAVLQYYHQFIPSADDGGTVRFLLVAAAIGSLFKRNASISGAEVGCQGEIGSACSMAAAGLAEVMGGSPRQIENAAEIGMEHHLGLTCDPIGGLVQVPCIERNAMAAVQAINAARLALRGEGQHLVSLDKVIQTMLDTGRDMQSKYKETSQGGLAVNVIEC